MIEAAAARPRRASWNGASWAPTAPARRVGPTRRPTVVTSARAGPVVAAAVPRAKIVTRVRAAREARERREKAASPSTGIRRSRPPPRPVPTRAPGLPGMARAATSAASRESGADDSDDRETRPGSARADSMRRRRARPRPRREERLAHLPADAGRPGPADRGEHGGVAPAGRREENLETDAPPRGGPGSPGRGGPGWCRRAPGPRASRRPRVVQGCATQPRSDGGSVEVSYAGT